jgi:hypothetical protein
MIPRLRNLITREVALRKMTEQRIQPLRMEDLFDRRSAA